MNHSVRPKLIVVMPVFNSQSFIKEAIESILNQTYKDFIFLIINDGSTDSSESFIRSYHDDRILVWSQPNRGPGECMNRALEYACATGIPYMARMDADDISLPVRLEKQLHLLLNNPAAAACGSNCYYMDSDGENIIGTSTVSSSSGLIRWEILHGLRGLIQGCCMFRTGSIKQVGGYSSQFSFAEEVDLFLRLAEKFDLLNLADFLYKIRYHANSMSTANVHNNVLFQFYALESYYRRRKGKPIRSFESFSQAPGFWTSYKIWREENMLKFLRQGIAHQQRLKSLIGAALIDPRRVVIRAIRKLKNSLPLNQNGRLY